MLEATSKFKLIGVGIVSKDKEEDSYFIEVHPVESNPSQEGDYNKPDEISIENQDIHGENVNLKIKKSKTITCKWIGIYNSNRLTAPDVVIGEMVYIYQYGGSDEYYWSSYTLNLRKKEKVVYYYSNKNESKPNEPSGEEGYYFGVDTKNKSVFLHTAATDGELTTYDMTINTQDGIATFEDGRGNYIQLDSSKDTYNMHLHHNYLSIVKDEYDIVCNHFSVNNPTNEIIQVLMDWTDVCTKQLHIESIGIMTSVSAQTIADFLAIKARLATFKNGAGYISTNPRPIVQESEPRIDDRRRTSDDVAQGRHITFDMRKDGGWNYRKPNTASVDGSDGYGNDTYEQDRNPTFQEARDNPGGMNFRLEGNMDIKTPLVKTVTDNIDTKSTAIKTETKTMETKASDIKTKATTEDKVLEGDSSFKAANVTEELTGSKSSKSKGLEIESNGEELLQILIDLLDTTIQEEHNYSYDSGGASVSSTTKVTNEYKDKYKAIKARLEKMKL